MIAQGYYFTAGNKGYFYRSSAQRKTDSVIRAIIDAVGKARGAHPDTIERAKQDRPTLEDFRRRIDAVTLLEKYTDNGTHYFTISGKNFSAAFPEQDFYNEIITF